MPSDRITIGRFSTLTHLTQKALRYYDSKGILVPAVKDRFTGYRYYTVTQVESALKIRTLCTLGFGLSEIGDILTAHSAQDRDAVRKLVERRKHEAQSEIARLEKVLSFIIENRDFSELFAMNVSEPVIKEIPAMRVLSGRRTGTYEEVCGQVSAALMEIIFSPENQKKGVTITGPFLSLCYDGEYRETDADIEMAIPIHGPVVVSDPGITVRTLPAVKAVSVVYRGPYEHEGFSVAFEKAFRYAAENGLEPAGPDRQVYLNNPDNTPAEELLTEVQIPVAG
ncbi:MAG: DNA-binding transcriptional regulator CueR [Methanoregulaceae archaeon PtaB.Bin009]|jgi:effector-binding domain-containing protein|nr:MAG: DNA-binding transcriptional regulator CueR [Methanoregulaceae archaeon PtaB.Bin009]OPY41544.1 MAG: DNA-binding transcriptional regulator CueR [Methanoregulaceae archaeon PtaU1.Bin066]HNQ30101.1 MerR family transcriptional regulator [Methanolinea sp.]